MPIYEFVCQSCGSQFDKLTSANWKERGIQCPQCQSAELDRVVSLVGSFSSGKSAGDSRHTSAAPSNTSSACANCHSGSCKTCH